MALKIETFEQEGSKYISLSKVENGKISERSFEYYDRDTIKIILSLVEANINSL